MTVAGAPCPYDNECKKFIAMFLEKDIVYINLWLFFVMLRRILNKGLKIMKFSIIEPSLLALAPI